MSRAGMFLAGALLRIDPGLITDLVGFTLLGAAFLPSEVPARDGYGAAGDPRLISRAALAVLTLITAAMHRRRRPRRGRGHDRLRVLRLYR